ncbi:MAG TPA: nuclear transport factor 2 family protein [Glycomyces sp.]|nr:nuclear transport factor 2 family protein [Glycomyces sp.]
MSDARIRELADRLELTELVAREALWLDGHRRDGAEAFFTEDATARTPGGEAEGPAAIAELANRAHGKYAATHHLPTGVVVDLDGDSASVRFSAAIALTTEGGEVVLHTSRYRLGARRTGAGWRFSRLAITPASATAPLPRAA